MATTTLNIKVDGSPFMESVSDFKSLVESLESLPEEVRNTIRAMERNMDESYAISTYNKGVIEIQPSELFLGMLNKLREAQ